MASFRLCCLQRLRDEFIDHQLRSLFLRDQTPQLPIKKDDQDGGADDRSSVDPVLHPVGSCHLVLAVHRWTANSAPWRVLHSGTVQQTQQILQERWEVVEYKYLVTVLKYIFLVSVLYSTPNVSDNFLLLILTF